MYKLNGGFTQHHFCMYNELKKRAGFSEYKSGAGFTLLELLITVAIISIVTTAIVLVINPVETLSQARDGRRISEVTSIDEAITLALQQNPALSEGDSNTVYLSLPSNTSGAGYIGTCADYQSLLPVLSGSWKYACVAQANLFKADGTGWVPMNFTSLSIIPLTSLPIDSVNNAAKGLYYAYVPGWEIDTNMESKKYQFNGSDDRESADGGDSLVLYEKGPNENAQTAEANARIVNEIRPTLSGGCSLGFGSDVSDSEFYNRWTLPGSGKIVVTKLWAVNYIPLDLTESMEIAIYNDSLPRDRISEIVTATSHSGDKWAYGSLKNQIVLDLGKTYIFGLGPKDRGNGYNLYGYDTYSCPDYLPNDPLPTMRSQAATGGLDAYSPIIWATVQRHGVFGISYAPY